MKIAKFEAKYYPMNKNVTKTLFLAATLFLFCSATALAQYYDIGSEKTSVKWKKMKSKNFEIIYPSSGEDGTGSGYGLLAKDYLKQVEGLYGLYADSIRYTYGLPKRFPLVLHPFNAESNGVTFWAPRQIDFFAQPYLDLLSTDPWDNVLSSHEGRHAWQVAHMNRGFFKVLYGVFGDQVIGAASVVLPSRWFLEGDAVVAETQIGKGGRGRNGFFLCEILKCIVPEGEDTKDYFYGKNRTWDRWRFGSVKAYSPDPYSTGYMINAMARHHSGDVDLAHNILNYEPLHFLNVNVVASAFKKYSGKTHREYIKDDMLKEFVELNENEEFEETLSDDSGVPMYKRPIARTGLKNGYFTEYHSITSVGKDSVIAVVEGYASTGFLVLFTKDENGWKEEALSTFEDEVEPIFYNDGKIYLSESNVDPRWGQHSSYGLTVFDLKTRTFDYPDHPKPIHIPQFARVSGEKDLYGLVYSSDESTGTPGFSSEICKVFTDEDADPLITVPGEQITSYAFGNQNEVYCTVVGKDGLRLDKITPSGNSSVTENILPSSFHIIKDLKYYKGDLFFITDWFGVPALCRMNPEKKEIRLACESGDITSFSIAEDGRLYVIMEIGDRGEFPYEENMVDVAIDPDMEYNYPLAEELSKQYKEKYGKKVEEYAAAVEKNAEDFKETDYSKGANLFRLHSWIPAYAEFSGETEGGFEEFYEEALPGVTLYSQNTLGTMKTMFGYGYEKRSGYLGKTKRLHSGHATINWSGWYPVIEGTVHFNDRIMYDKDKFSVRSHVAAYIPLVWEAEGWDSGITPLVSWSYRNDEAELEEDETSPRGYSVDQFSRHQLNLVLGAYKSLDVARAEVFPRWGIGGRVASSLSPKGGHNFGSEFSAYVYGYVPGLTFNQGLRLSAAFQRQNVEGKKYWLDNHIDGPRGFTEDIYGRNIFTATADYAIPIYLGDVSIGPLAYLQQLQLIPFFDYSRVDFLRPTGGLMGFYTGKHYQWEDRYSFGADVMFKGHFLRIGFPMYIGVRYARTNKPCDYGNSIPATYDGKGGRNYCTLLLGITFY